MAKDRGYTVGALAAQPVDEHDVAILERVAVMYRGVDPVPDGLVERLQFAITLDALHAEIAQLERMDDLVGARGDAAADVQTITFTSQSMTTMITVTPAGADHVRIDGWAADGSLVDVDLRAGGTTLRATADVDGRFVFESVPRGMVQFILRHPEGSARPPVVTPSLEL